MCSSFGSCDHGHDTNHDDFTEEMFLVDMRSRVGQFSEIFENTFDTKLTCFLLGHRVHSGHRFEVQFNETNDRERNLIALAQTN